MTREHIEFVLSEYSTDALAGKLLELFDEEAASYQHTINELNKALSENKGEWIYDKSIHNWRCSKCGQTPPPTGYVGMADFMATHFKFCNHCGADMRGERMTYKERQSCIQTIQMLRRLAFNIHGVMDVVDDSNCNKMIELLEHGIDEMCQEHYRQGLKDADAKPETVFDPD